MKIGIVAGEASGDLLGADLIEQLKQIDSTIEFVGMGGPAMRAAGCTCWYDISALNVMGLVEVIKVLPRILRLNHRIAKRFIAESIDLFIGIDQQEFNQLLAKKIKRANINTIQYVSPSVWAWRQARFKKIKQSVDLVLCLFPFEKKFYDAHQQQAAYVGHPLADKLLLKNDKVAHRKKLNLNLETRVIALLPGSRRTEIKSLARPFIETASILAKTDPTLQFIIALRDKKAQDVFAETIADHNVSALNISIILGQSQDVMAAADAVLLASGTATLEAMLVKCQMVVAYKVHALTYFLLKKMIKTPWFSLPNIIANESLVPEFIQDDVTAENLAQALLTQLSAEKTKVLEQTFTQLHKNLQQSSQANVAEVVFDFIQKEMKQHDRTAT